MITSSTHHGIVLTTASSEAEAKSIAVTLLESNLAACVNVIPIRSLYSWKGKIHDEAEWQLVIKANLNQFAELEQKIRSIHSYEIPEIIAIPIVQGSLSYLEWMSEQLERPAN